MTSSSARPAAALLLVLVLQAVLWFLPPGVSLRQRVFAPIGDAPEYVELAAGLSERAEFSRELHGVRRPELFRTPGYPLLLAGLRNVFGDSPIAILGLQLLLSLLTVLATWRLAWWLGLTGRAAGAAALLLAASPNLAFHATKAVTETSFTLLLAVCLLLLARYRAAGPTGRAWAPLFGAGVAAGLMALFRPIALYWPLVVGAWVGWRCLRARPRLAWLALVPVLAAGLTVAPWFARNHRVFGRAMLSTAAEHNLFLYNAATVVAVAEQVSVAGARDLMQAEARARFGTLDSTDEAGYWARLGVVARGRLARHPLLAAATQLAGFAANFAVPLSIGPLLVHTGAPPSADHHVMQQAVGLVTRGRLAEAWQVVRHDRLGLAGPLFWVWFGLGTLHLGLLLVLAGVGLGSQRRRQVAWLLLPVLYFTLLTGPVGEARFRAPVEPALAVIAAGGLFGHGHQEKRGRARWPAPE
jgi:4-amino-4-deoxy-L-arabinose transferase-like glycosyltransferase